MTVDRPLPVAPRVLAGGALTLCSLTVAALLWWRGDELDTDSLLPFSQETVAEGARTPTPTEALPSSTAVVVLLLLVAVVAVPVATPRRFFRASLFISTSLAGSFVVVTALRLGIVFVPVLACLVAAILWPVDRARTAERPGVAGFEAPLP